MTSTILVPLKSKINGSIRIRDPNSEYGARIRIHGSAEYGYNADMDLDPEQDPKHWFYLDLWAHFLSPGKF